MDGFAQLFFDVSESLHDYRNAAENHIRELRRLIQTYDHLAPHEFDGEGWYAYMQARSERA